MSNNSNLKQQEIVADILQQIPSIHEVSLLDYNFSGVNYRVGSSKLVLQDGELNVLFTVGTNTNRVFISLTDGEPSQIAFILANIEQFDKDVEMVNTCDCIRLPDSEYLEGNSCVGAVMMRASVSPIISNFRDISTLSDGTVIQYMLAVFISSDEYRVFSSKGFDSLLDSFQEKSKDIYSINQNG